MMIVVVVVVVVGVVVVVIIVVVIVVIVIVVYLRREAKTMRLGFRETLLYPPPLACLFVEEYTKLHPKPIVPSLLVTSICPTRNNMVIFLQHPPQADNDIDN